MQSIKQKQGFPVPWRRLPDFRNLGVLLRTLLFVNAMALLTALIAEPLPARLGEVFLVLVGRVELPLFVIVAALSGLSPWLRRQRVLPATVLLLAVVGLVISLLHPVLAGPQDGLWRWLLWGWGAALAVCAYFDYRERRLTPSLVEARLMALTARIRPHFLFNALNGVLGVMRSEPRRAEQALEELAELFRILMRENRELVSLSEELRLCRRYLDLESLRLGERLQLGWRIDADLESALVPPLMLQPLLENAIYHGIEPLAEPSEVTVRIAREGTELLLEVENPLPGEGAAQPGNRMALDNIRERLSLFFDLEGRLDSRQEAGRHRVTIRLPYRTSLQQSLRTSLEKQESRA